MNQIKLFIELTRLKKPIGYMLLFWPCAWGLTLAYDFSQNLKIYYLDNKITAEYGDFSIGRNSMIISKEVIYTNPENVLKADVVKVNIETKDTVIYMHEENKKVNIKSIK